MGENDLGLVVVGALLEVWVLLVCLGVLDLVVRVDRVQDVGGELAATATEPGDVSAQVPSKSASTFMNSEK